MSCNHKAMSFIAHKQIGTGGCTIHWCPSCGGLCEGNVWKIPKSLEAKAIILAYERFFKRTFSYEEAELYNKQWLRETLPYGTAK